MTNAVSRKIKAINNFLELFKADSKSQALTLYLKGEAIGVVRRSDVALLEANFPGIFQIDGDRLEFDREGLTDPDWVTDIFAYHLGKLRRKDLFLCLKGWRDEFVAVSHRFGDQPMFAIERAATPLFGLKRYGVHINGFVKENDEIKFVWLQRRSKTKQQFPGLLDIIVSGGLEAGLTPMEAVRKECFEEASIPKDLCDKIAKSVGTVSFVYEDDLGTHPLTFFCYDANLPADFEPTANDGEVDQFIRFPICDLLDLIMDPKRFKATSAPTVLDFLIRHHVIDSSYGCALINTASTIHQNLQEYPNRR